MLFRSKRVDAAWDTWMYYADGTYYLYYLITDISPGEGFGVAVSRDGVHFQDHGIQLGASDQMVFYLGTGSVWEPINGRGYLCNFSEWRMHGDQMKQQIFFAASKDLIHWEKLDEALSLEIDTRYYTDREDENARWDCINTLRTEEGYLGCWTARPHGGPGIGFGRSCDGLHWQVLPPPKMELSIFEGREVESGSITCHAGRFYMLVGSYGADCGVAVMVADSPCGPYEAQRVSPAIFANQEFEHGYFARFFETPEGTLANFHVLTREQNAHRRHYTYLAPIKKVHYDEAGILRLKWWANNDALIGESTDAIGPACAAVCQMTGGESLSISLKNGDACDLTVNADGSAQLCGGGVVKARIERGLDFSGQIEVKLLLRGALMEFYVDDWYMFCYTFVSAPCAVKCGGRDVDYHRLKID